MATKKYLDDNGLLYFWQKIKGFLQQTYQQRELNLAVNMWQRIE